MQLAELEDQCYFAPLKQYTGTHKNGSSQQQLDHNDFKINATKITQEVDLAAMFVCLVRTVCRGQKA